LKYLAYNLGAADKMLKRYKEALDNDKLPVQDMYYMSLPASV